MDVCPKKRSVVCQIMAVALLGFEPYYMFICNSDSNDNKSNNAEAQFFWRTFFDFTPSASNLRTTAAVFLTIIAMVQKEKR